MLINGSNGKSSWWRGLILASALGWMTWVTVNVANYVSGEVRGERLTTTEARLMIELADHQLRTEQTAEHTVVETRINERLKVVEEQVRILNEHSRQRP